MNSLTARLHWMIYLKIALKMSPRRSESNVSPYPFPITATYSNSISGCYFRHQSDAKKIWQRGNFMEVTPFNDSLNKMLLMLHSKKKIPKKGQKNA
jgi:hypothetical protein